MIVKTIIQDAEVAIVDALLGPGASQNLATAIEKKIAADVLAAPGLDQATVTQTVNDEIDKVIALVEPHVPSFLLALATPVVDRLADGVIATAYADAQKLLPKDESAPAPDAKPDSDSQAAGVPGAAPELDGTLQQATSDI